MPDDSYLRSNVGRLTERVASLAEKLGTAPAKIVAVTKSGTDEELLALAALGIRDIGENRPQEVARRYDLLRANGFDTAVHEIGNLQKNKVKLILGKATLIHSLGSLSLAQEIERLAVARQMRVPVLIEINSGREEAKGGIFPEDAFRFYEAIRPLRHLSVEGVMTMGPAFENKEDYRPCFRETKAVFDEIGKRYGYDTATPTLSMGMSDSYDVAIEEGATLVRVGRMLFRKE